MNSERFDKPKLLIIVDWFFPGYKAGGPIQSTLNLAFALKDKYNIKVLTTDTDHGEVEPYHDIVANEWINNLDPDISCLYLKKSTLTLSELKRRILEEEADYVYLNHMFSPRFVIYPLWLKFTGKLGSKLVVSPRGALYQSALNVKPWKKFPFLWLLQILGIKKKIIFHATNEREKQAIENFFPKSKVIIADNLPKSIQPEHLSIEKKKGELKCVFIARIVPIKNLLYLLNVLSRVKKDVSLTIIGPDEDRTYWLLCKQQIDNFKSNIKVEFLGPKNNNMLSEIIKQHHLFVLPTEGENFGHSIFEALLAGRPVLISDQTPWRDLSNLNVGWDIPLSNRNQFQECIETAADWDQQCFDKWSKSAWNFASAFIADQKRKKAYQLLFS